jgi:hypothetical protein
MNNSITKEVEKRLRQKELDYNKYYKDPEKARRKKIIQKISREGTIPTEASIDKYKITIEELFNIKDYLGINEKPKILDKVLKRIKYINEKQLKDKENNNIN